jgi:hypothetical protein
MMTFKQNIAKMFDGTTVFVLNMWIVNISGLSKISNFIAIIYLKELLMRKRPVTSLAGTMKIKLNVLV